jgi:RNase P/RNase MRP subunit POP5
MIREIRNQCRTLFEKDCKEMGIYLTRFDGKMGIIKCNHIEKDNTINLLTSIEKISTNSVKIETVGTSGTIKALIRKHM